MKLLTLLLAATVVFVSVNLFRDVILLPVDLGSFLPGQLAAVGSTIVADFTIDPSFFVLEICSLAGRQLTALDALRDAVLLVLGALPDFALDWCSARPRCVCPGRSGLIADSAAG